MENTHPPHRMKDFFGARLNEKFPDFEHGWRELVNKVGDEFVNHIKTHFQSQYEIFREISDFQITVVVDNNFIFGQIKNIVERNKSLETSFIYRISKLSSVKIYAPPKLVEELFDKIEKILKGDKELARKYANTILERIEVKDAFWINEWKTANNLIGHVDSDDVPYLALALEVGSHAIISKDAIFHTQGVSKVWTIQDTDKVITNYHRGCVSFCFIGTMPSILQLIWEIFLIIFKVIGEILKGFVFALAYLAGGTISIAGKIPSNILVGVLGLGALALLFSEKARSGLKDVMGEVRNVIQVCVEGIAQFINWLSSLIEQIWDVFKPVGITAIEFAAYFLSEYYEMKTEVVNLEKARAK